MTWTIHDGSDLTACASVSIETWWVCSQRFGFDIALDDHGSKNSIMGVGATERLSAVRWGVAGQVVSAWILTWPSCMFLAYWLEKLFKSIY